MSLFDAIDLFTGNFGGRLRCSFCGRSSDQLAKLLKGPVDFICDDCVGACERILSNVGPIDPAAVAGERRCSFCDKHQNDVPTLIAGPAVHICGICVMECRRILDSSPTPAPPA